jgi:hypothetical protein
LDLVGNMARKRAHGMGRGAAGTGDDEAEWDGRMGTAMQGGNGVASIWTRE